MTKGELYFMEQILLVISLCYLLIINIAGFVSMALDKHFATKHMWRIPEKVLFLIAILVFILSVNAGEDLRFFNALKR